MKNKQFKVRSMASEKLEEFLNENSEAGWELYCIKKPVGKYYPFTVIWFRDKE